MTTVGWVSQDMWELAKVLGQFSLYMGNFHARWKLLRISLGLNLDTYGIYRVDTKLYSLSVGLKLNI
jgi:hypothetical protein